MTRVEDNNDNNVVASNFGDIKTGQTGTNYTYFADGSLKSDLDEEIAYIDWYPSGKIKRIYRTATSEQSDLYFEYDPMGMRTLKVEMTRTGTTLNTANNWKYTYYAADANGTTLAIYELDENDQDNTLKKTESMLYGGSRLGIDVEAVTVAGYSIDPLTKCNTDGRASFMLEVTGPLLGQPTQDIAIFLDGTLVGAMPHWGGGTGGVTDLIALINGSGAGVEATQLTGETVGSDYVALIEIKEIEPGTYPEGAAVTHTIGGIYVTITTQREFTTGECYSARNLGMKYYEISNHLGNVMEVVSDRKISVDDNTYNATTGDFISATSDGIIDHFEADVVQYSDYYPYGMTQPGRNGSVSDRYRYAFNGMETDGEVSGSGNSYTTQFRQYDPRLGRWKSREPKEAFYPDWSPFVGMGNNPTLFVDNNGLDPIVTVRSFEYNGSGGARVHLDVEIHVKVINGSSVYVNMDEYVAKLNNKGANISQKKYDGSVITKDLQGAAYNTQLLIDSDGNLSPEGNRTDIGTLDVWANVKYTFEVIESTDEIGESDNVIILTDGISRHKGVDPLGTVSQGSVMLVNVQQSKEDLVHTAMHETTHLAGRHGEDYINLSGGYSEDAGTGSIMDVSGYDFNSETIGGIGDQSLYIYTGGSSNSHREMDEDLKSSASQARTSIEQINKNAQINKQEHQRRQDANKPKVKGKPKMSERYMPTAKF